MANRAKNPWTAKPIRAEKCHSASRRLLHWSDSGVIKSDRLTINNQLSLHRAPPPPCTALQHCGPPSLPTVHTSRCRAREAAWQNVSCSSSSGGSRRYVREDVPHSLPPLLPPLSSLLPSLCLPDWLAPPSSRLFLSISLAGSYLQTVGVRNQRKEPEKRPWAAANVVSKSLLHALISSCFHITLSLISPLWPTGLIIGCESREEAEDVI